MNALSDVLSGWFVRWLRMFSRIFAECRDELPESLPVISSFPEENNELLPVRQQSRFEGNPCFILGDGKVIYKSQKGNKTRGTLKSVHGPVAVITRKGDKPFRRTLSSTPLLA